MNSAVAISEQFSFFFIVELYFYRYWLAVQFNVLFHIMQHFVRGKDKNNTVYFWALRLKFYLKLLLKILLKI